MQTRIVPAAQDAEPSRPRIPWDCSSVCKGLFRVVGWISNVTPCVVGHALGTVRSGRWQTRATPDRTCSRRSWPAWYGSNTTPLRSIAQATYRRWSATELQRAVVAVAAVAQPWLRARGRSGWPCSPSGRPRRAAGCRRQVGASRPATAGLPGDRRGTAQAAQRVVVSPTQGVVRLCEPTYQFSSDIFLLGCCGTSLGRAPRCLPVPYRRSRRGLFTGRPSWQNREAPVLRRWSRHEGREVVRRQSKLTRWRHEN